MKYAYIEQELCDRSPGCPPIKICPVNAIYHEKTNFLSYGPSIVNKDVCIGCGKCVNYCPRGAIKIVSR